MRSYAHVAAIISWSYSEPCLAYSTFLVCPLLMLSKRAVHRPGYSDCALAYRAIQQIAI